MDLHWVLLIIATLCSLGIGYIVRTSKIDDLDEFYIISDGGDEVESIYNKEKK